ncbi:Transcription initiation factor TFIID subunit 11 [Astathelohania contejeani]|uniref:Transcription initiation factor TFIID subunit 11 n=1 Tax=Astathelohania contejeani TaxID=164912 RepID=A0ABQ7HXM3_9MICR|nr:Transcription initiation factor TFIID subunit 11 [Thelohania contejeani]
MSSDEESQEIIKPEEIIVQNDSQPTESESEDLNVNSNDSKDTSPYKFSLQEMLDQMSPDEFDRYESFRRAGFNKVAIRKLCNSILKQSCNPNFVISVAGIAKVFVGEMVGMAKQIQFEMGDSGPLLPSHIDEAYRRLYHLLPNMKNFF